MATRKVQKGPKRPVAKRPLDRERIEAVALRLIEKEGLADFSMRHLGAALGVEAMSLYHHYPSKAHLLDALLDRMLLRVPAPDPGPAWRERMRSFGLAYRALALEYPAFAQYMIVHRTNTRVGLAWLESVVRLFADAGFEPEAAARSFRTLGYYLVGAVLDETTGYAKGPTAADPVPPREQAELAPTLARLGPYFAREHWERTFLTGLDVLLDDFERRRLAAEQARRDC